MPEEPGNNGEFDCDEGAENDSCILLKEHAEFCSSDDEEGEDCDQKGIVNHSEHGHFCEKAVFYLNEEHCVLS